MRRGSWPLLLAVVGVAVRGCGTDPGRAATPTRAVAGARRRRAARPDPTDRRAAGQEPASRLAPKTPQLPALRDAALRSLSPARARSTSSATSGRGWATRPPPRSSTGGGASAQLVIASVADERKARGLLRRRRRAPATRYRGAVVRRFSSGNAAACVARLPRRPGGSSPSSAAIDVAGRGRSLPAARQGGRGDARRRAGVADAAGFATASGGLRRAERGCSATRLAARQPAARGPRGAHRRGRGRGLTDPGARSVGTGSRAHGAPRSPRASRPARRMLAGPTARRRRRRAVAAPVARLRLATCSERGLARRRPRPAPPPPGFAAWVTRGDAAPVIGLAAPPTTRKGLREALAAPPGPGRRALSTPTRAAACLRSDRGRRGRLHAPGLPGFAAHLPIGGEPLVAAIAAPVGAFLTRGGSRLTADARVPLRDLRDPDRGRVARLLDVRQLLALGEQTGFTARTFAR